MAITNCSFSGSSPFNNIPVSLFFMISGIQKLFVAITGHPAEEASTSTSGVISFEVGNTKQNAFKNRFVSFFKSSLFDLSNFPSYLIHWLLKYFFGGC